MPKTVPHELTLFAFFVDDTGRSAIVDIVETSRRYASRHIRRFRRDEQIMAIAAAAPGRVPQRQEFRFIRTPRPCRSDDGIIGSLLKSPGA